MATDLETASGRDTASVEVTRPAAERRSRGPAVVLGLVVVGGFAVYTLLALAVGAPRVHPDEVRYLIAASSLVEGEGLTLRGADYGFGPLLALVLAAILRLAGSVDAAYDWFKAANALFFALTAVPVYLLARRLVGAWWAVLAAALSVAIPSSISVATVMTESLSYLAAAWALYAIAMALERPTVLRQLAVLGAVAAAFLTRPQFGILYATWVGALVLLWLIVPGSRPRTRRDLVGYWPTALPLVLGVLAFAARLAAGASAKDSLGAYWELWRGYDPLQVGKWLVYHLGDFTVYLAVVPVAVAPIVLWELGRAGRAGIAARGRIRRAVRLGQRHRAPRRRRVHEHAVGLRPAPRPLRLLPRPAVARRARRLARLRPAAPPARRGRGRRRRGAGAPADPPVPSARERGGDRHRPGRAVGADRGGARRPRAGVRPPRPGARDRRAPRGDVPPAATDRAGRAPRRRGRLLRRHVVLRVGAADRRARGPRLRGRPRARVDRRAAARRRAGDEALRRHELRLRPRAARALPDGVLQLDRRPRRLHRRLGPGRPPDRARRRGAVGRCSSARGARSSRTTSSRSPGIELDGRRVAEGTAAGLVLWQVGGPVRVVGASSNEQLRRKLCA